MREFWKRYGACPEGREWAGDKSIDEIWATCTNPFWLAWLLTKFGADLNVARIKKDFFLDDSTGVSAIDFSCGYKAIEYLGLDKGVESSILLAYIKETGNFAKLKDEINARLQAAS